MQKKVNNVLVKMEVRAPNIYQEYKCNPIMCSPEEFEQFKHRIKQAVTGELPFMVLETANGTVILGSEMLMNSVFTYKEQEIV